MTNLSRWVLENVDSGWNSHYAPPIATRKFGSSMEIYIILALDKLLDIPDGLV